MTRDSKGVREIGRFLNRYPSTISREMDRNTATESGYCATRASGRTGDSAESQATQGPEAGSGWQIVGDRRWSPQEKVVA